MTIGPLYRRGGWIGGTLLPAVGFYMAGLVNLFVPSGGGQWAVQAPVVLPAAAAIGRNGSWAVSAVQAPE